MNFKALTWVVLIPPLCIGALSAISADSPVQADSQITEYGTPLSDQNSDFATATADKPTTLPYRNSLKAYRNENGQFVSPSEINNNSNNSELEFSAEQKLGTAQSRSITETSDSKHSQLPPENRPEVQSSTSGMMVDTRGLFRSQMRVERKQGKWQGRCDLDHDHASHAPNGQPHD